MANDNLTGQFISDTYKRLIVLSEDGYITDGTGSIINELPVTASFAQTALFLEGFDPNNKPAETDPVFTAMSGSFVTTASYYQDSASFAANIFKLKLHDYNEPYSYCGTAPASSAEADSVWSITRIFISSSGDVTTASATMVDWDDRYTHTYY